MFQRENGDRTTGSERARPGPAPAAAGPGPVGFGPSAVLGLQRSVGNAAVARALAAPPAAGLISEAELASNLRRELESRPGGGRSAGDVCFRLPTAADLKATFTGGTVPEATVKDRIATALTRMAKEGRLATKDAVPDIIKRVFPAPGKFDEAEYAKVADLSDRSKVYENVADAGTKVSAVDKPKLIAVMKDADKLIDKAVADAANLKLVFGSKDGTAKAVYGKAKTALGNVITNIDTAVDTDYNRDDEEIGLGGWADFGSQHIHLERTVAQVADKDDATITIIHECCHLADPSVKDKGYYGSDGFEAMTEDEKVTNAAHFEEVPDRILKKSTYGNVEFKPGVKAKGGAVTFEDEVKRDASEYLRKAWDKAVDVHMFLREIRGDIIGGSKASFTANNVRILELSKLMHLTVHTQPAATATLNQIDIVLAEGVARATTRIKREAKKQTVPSPHPNPKSFYVDKLLDDSIKAYGALTGNFADDRKLMDWLVAEYKKPL